MSKQSDLFQAVIPAMLLGAGLVAGYGKRKYSKGKSSSRASKIIFALPQIADALSGTAQITKKVIDASKGIEPEKGKVPKSAIRQVMGGSSAFAGGYTLARNWPDIRRKLSELNKKYSVKK